MSLTAATWVLAIVCAVLSGMAKTGVPGLGILAVPLLAQALGDGRASTGLLLPLLCLADCFAVGWYRRHASWPHIGRLLPWVVVGMIPGWLTLDLVEPRAVNRLIGSVVLVMLGLHVWRRRAADLAATDAAPDATPVRGWRRLLRLGSAPPRGAAAAAVFGLVAGYVTTVSNAAGPVMNLYLLSMAFSKDAFMGTGAWYFFLINLAKVPIYLAVHPPMITAASLAVDLRLLPAVVVGALSGRWMYSRLPQRAFDLAVLALTAIAAARMLR